MHELMFADDCALAAHSIQEAQHLLDCFVAATHRFGLRQYQEERGYVPTTTVLMLPASCSNNQQYPASSR